MLVILVSVVAAVVQLRHIRAGNELQALLSLVRDFRDPGLQTALTYVQKHLPQRLQDASYRCELETIGFVDPAIHPEMIVCNWFNEMGTLVKRGLVSEDPFMDLFGRLIAHCWRQVSPAIAIMRRTRGEAQYHDFEYLASRAQAWLISARAHARADPRSLAGRRSRRGCAGLNERPVLHRLHKMNVTACGQSETGEAAVSAQSTAAKLGLRRRRI